MTFVAEADPPGADSIRFRYLLGGPAEVVLSREWWEQMDCPEYLAVTVEPEDYDS